ncbi:Hint domain-containing protein [Streptomyces griseosporeus]|uniref:Hint domain-containing protein n=1 Tax=Streptomyces griseosporeus TaxID=1910 RepID=UPI0036F5B2FA
MRRELTRGDYVREGASRGAAVGAAGGAIIGGVSGTVRGAVAGPGGAAASGAIGAAQGTVIGAFGGWVLGGLYGTARYYIDHSSGCFSGETLVSTESGPLPIESITYGQKVYTFHPIDGGVTLNKVIKAWKSQRTSTLLLRVDGETVRCTPGHRFYRNNVWVAARDLQPGDHLLNGENHLIRLQAIEERTGLIDVFNLTVENAHSYLVGKSGLFVHNLKETDPGTTEADDDDR